MGSDEDSDSEAEADRRMAMIFDTHQTIDPNKDVDLLTVQHKISHTRAKSLPPSMVVEVVRDDESPPPPLPPRIQDESGEGVDGDGPQGEVKSGRDEPGKGVESSLDRSPSHMRKFLKKPAVDAVSWVWLQGGVEVWSVGGGVHLGVELEMGSRLLWFYLSTLGRLSCQPVSGVFTSP